MSELGRGMWLTVSALTRLDNQDAKVDPDLQPLTVLKPADLISHLWQRYSSTALLPLASAPSLRKEMSTFSQHNIVRMEGKINSVIQKTLDSESTSTIDRLATHHIVS